MAVELGQVMVGDGILDGTLVQACSSVFKAFKTLNEGEEWGGRPVRGCKEAVMEAWGVAGAAAWLLYCLLRTSDCPSLTSCCIGAVAARAASGRGCRW